MCARERERESERDVVGLREKETCVKGKNKKINKNW